MHHGYDVQSTYMPPEDPNSRAHTDNGNPFGLYDLDDNGHAPFPQAENPFVGAVAGGPPAMHSGGTASIRVAPAAAQSDTSLVFHGRAALDCTWGSRAVCCSLPACFADTVLADSARDSLGQIAQLPQICG